MVISYSGHSTHTALDINWIISISISGIVAVVGIIFIANIFARRSGHKDRKINGWIC